MNYFLLFGLVVFLSDVTAREMAPPELNETFIFDKIRCENWGDSLTIEEAVQRMKWARRCRPEFKSLYNRAVNTAAEKKQNPPYPTFGIVRDSDGMFLNTTNPEYFAPKIETAECNTPPEYVVIGFCISSCYSPDQEVSTPTGSVSIKEAKDKRVTQLMAVSPDSVLHDFKLTPTFVDQFISEIKDGWQNLLQFHTRDNGQLKVTLNHPLVDGSGKIREASQFKVGEFLVKANNQLDEIVSIEKIPYFGKVYNVFMQSSGQLENIIVAQGFLNGSAHYQNSEVSYLNRVVLRETLIPESLL